MNNGSNAPIYHMPAMAMESHGVQQSMYQQRTYVDRSRMAVTDVYVQEHVSQSSCSWSVSSPHVHVRAPVYLQTGRAPYIGNNPGPPPPPQGQPHPSVQGRFGYMSVPGNVQYYAASSASMNSYGQMYMQHSSASANVGGVYVPPYHSMQMRTKETSSQTLAHIKRSCDAATQTDLIGDAPPMTKLNVSDSKDSSNSSLDSSEIQGVQQGERRNSEVTLPVQRLQDITRISLQGSDIAERLANAHRQRPCFKKMDTLCARLKQDLLRPDGVLPNINSQGIAWAVKDFIFVFTRIVNSWVILKGYVYNTPEGLNKIKDELPDGFMAAFDCWQISTLTLVDMIIKSFVNLDSMLQKQKNSFSKPDINNWSSNGNSSDSNSSNKTLNGTDIVSEVEAGRGPSAYSTPQSNTKNSASGDALDNSFNRPQVQLNPNCMDNKPMAGKNLNYLYTMVQDSEEAQRCVNANGTYLKTGTYTPLMKDATQVEQSPQTPPKSIPMVWVQSNVPNARNSPCLPAQPLPQQSLEQSKTVLKSPTAKLKSQCRHNDVKPYTTPMSLMGREMARKLFELSNRIMQMQNIDRFFQKLFTLNYYPYFYERCQHEFIDVRAIILKCESATYQHVFQAIHDLRRIIFLVRNDLKDHTNMDLRLYTALYERSINEMLSKPPYQIQHFEHITGRPGEKLFNFDI
ncbi:protein mitoshell [Drosophila innubila]|uniref:protein mitoshell n=1 Tax=Drosophila innubila TaxID=198719 RepID=UPI00148E1BA5|nr:protein mitoshell [Drosophila innubila]